MNVSFTRSLKKGFRNALIVAVGAALGSIGSPEVADGFKDAGVYGTALVMAGSAAASALADYVKRLIGPRE